MFNKLDTSYLFVKIHGPSLGLAELCSKSPSVCSRFLKYLSSRFLSKAGVFALVICSFIFIFDKSGLYFIFILNGPKIDRT